MPSIFKKIKRKLIKAYLVFYPNGIKIPNLQYSEREFTVAQILKKASGQKKINSFLNVGFHSWHEDIRHWWIKICEANNIDWKILEAFKANVRDTIEKGCPAEKVLHGNILDTSSYPTVDCLFFWHGPEHIEKSAFLKALPEIEKKGNKLIIFGMPLGEEPQDEAYGNPFEKHVSAWKVDDWEKLGYKVIPVYDRKDYPHITVYKIKTSN